MWGIASKGFYETHSMTDLLRHWVQEYEKASAKGKLQAQVGRKSLYVRVYGGQMIVTSYNTDMISIGLEDHLITFLQPDFYSVTTAGHINGFLSRAVNWRGSEAGTVYISVGSYYYSYPMQVGMKVDVLGKVYTKPNPVYKYTIDRKSTRNAVKAKKLIRTAYRLYANIGVDLIAMAWSDKYKSRGHFACCDAFTDLVDAVTTGDAPERLTVHEVLSILAYSLRAGNEQEDNHKASENALSREYKYWVIHSGEVEHNEIDITAKVFTKEVMADGCQEF